MTPPDDATRELRLPGPAGPAGGQGPGPAQGGYGNPQGQAQSGYGNPQGQAQGGYGYPQPGMPGAPGQAAHGADGIRDNPTTRIGLPGSRGGRAAPAPHAGAPGVHAPAPDQGRGGMPGGQPAAGPAGPGGTGLATAPERPSAPAAPKTDDDARSPVDIAPRQIGMIIAGLMLGMFLSSLDQTIVSTSMRTIADDLNGLSIQAWVSTAYLVALSVTTPLYGKLSDMYGRKPFFIAAITIFILGSLSCAYADSMYWLAASRGVQGLGAGGLVTLGLTIIADIAAPRDRPKYQGIFMAVYGLSSVLGPLLGGLLSGQDKIFSITGWRWVFLVNVPTGFLALVVVALFLKLPNQRRDTGRRIDWWGAVLLPVGLVPVLVVAEQGDDWGWTSPESIGCYALGAVGVILFLVVEKIVKLDALVPLKLFSSPTFRMSMVTASLVGVGMFGGIVLVPQYLQIVRGATPTEAGLMTVPMMFGIMVGSIVSGGGIARSGHYKIFVTIGTALMGTGLGLFHFVHIDAPLWRPMFFMVIFGVGLGFCMQTLTAAAQNAVPVEAMGLGTALVTFFRQIGGSLGVAALLSTLFHTVTGNISDALEKASHNPEFMAALKDPKVQADPDNAAFFEAMKSGSDGGGVLKDSSFLQHLDPRLAEPFKSGFLESVNLVFLIAAAVMVLGFLAAVILKEVPIRAEAAAEAGAPEGVVDEGYAEQLDSQTMTLRMPLESPTMTLRIVAAPEETTMTIALPRRRRARQPDEAPWQETPPQRLP